MTEEQLPAALADWRARGAVRPLAGEAVFTVDVPPVGPPRSDPLLVIHGFPTASFDFHRVVDRLAAGRRVLLLDLPGYGFSAKADRAYTIEGQADVVMAFAASVGLTRLALLTHDMGDTVGGELLARQMEGRWPVEVTRRVLTNGSIYIAMAQLSAGQRALLDLPDAALPASSAPSGPALADALGATTAGTDGLEAELTAMAASVVHGGGARLLPRLIRYIEQRRRTEGRYTGAIERHRSSLHVVWGAEDPIAVLPMTDRLLEARPDATREVLDQVGHFPMVEAPERFAAAVAAGLDR